jgi:hypothetical protein
MKRLVLALILVMPSPLWGQAILNVERLQRQDVSGAHGEMTARFALKSGNTDILQAGGDLGAGLLTERHWLRFFTGMERLRQGGKDVLDNRYAHIRYSYRFAPRLSSFHFLQFQTNQNLLLRRRWLLGSGLRHRALDGRVGRLDLGSGLMMEVEQLARGKLEPGEDPRTETLRMANFVVGSGDLGEGSRWTMVVYYQPDVTRLVDYRLLGEMGLSAQVTGALSMDTSLDWRHDSRAPAGLKRNDMGIRMGFTIRLQ